MRNLVLIAFFGCSLFVLPATANGQEIHAKPGDTLTVQAGGMSDKVAVLGVPKKDVSSH